MNIRLVDVVCFALIVAASYGLYMVKWQVHDLKRQNMMAEAQIAEQTEALHILDAEWAYLNRPDRLRNLTEKYLALEPEAGQQMVDITRLMEVPEAVQTAEADSLIEGVHLTSVSSETQGF